MIVVQIQQYIKRTLNHDQLGLIPGMQGLFNIRKSLMQFTIINRLKINNHMIIEMIPKIFENLQHPFVIKAVSK